MNVSFCGFMEWVTQLHKHTLANVREKIWYKLFPMLVCLKLLKRLLSIYGSESGSIFILTACFFLGGSPCSPAQASSSLLLFPRHWSRFNRCGELTEFWDSSRESRISCFILTRPVSWGVRLRFVRFGLSSAVDWESDCGACSRLIAMEGLFLFAVFAVVWFSSCAAASSLVRFCVSSLSPVDT